MYRFDAQYLFERYHIRNARFRYVSVFFPLLLRRGEKRKEPLGNSFITLEYIPNGNVIILYTHNTREIKRVIIIFNEVCSGRIKFSMNKRTKEHMNVVGLWTNFHYAI